MLFNSIEFGIFLPIVFILYWFVTNRSLKLQNLLILIASYIFYGWWDWRFLSLIIFSSFVDYYVGIGLSKTEDTLKRKLILLTSISINLGFLAFFKYYNFFAENFAEAFTLFGKNIEVSRLNIVLPVGISFYTFQTLSYSIDVYKRKLEPTKDIISFFSFVSFFPQLVAGPIERASNLLPQFYKKRKFQYHTAVDGLRQILWGLFKKVVIADNCAEYVNIIFDNYQNYSGITLIVGSIFFAFQIYCDFSGYSDIAIGTSKLFGFKLMQNFAFPYFSRDIAEFWRRWHISLSTWFRDYLYIPLGGSRGSRGVQIRNVFIIFIVSGFWHGANWTFIIWGALNAIYFLPLLLLNKNRENTNIIGEGKIFPSIKEMTQMIVTFTLTIFAWIFFRAENISHALGYIKRIFSNSISLEIHSLQIPYKLYFAIILLLTIDWIGRKDECALQKIGLNWKSPYRWAFYIIIFFIILNMRGSKQEFIYFQF